MSLYNFRYTVPCSNAKKHRSCLLCMCSVYALVQHSICPVWTEQLLARQPTFWQGSYRPCMALELVCTAPVFLIVHQDDDQKAFSSRTMQTWGFVVPVLVCSCDLLAEHRSSWAVSCTCCLGVQAPYRVFKRMGIVLYLSCY